MSKLNYFTKSGAFNCTSPPHFAVFSCRFDTVTCFITKYICRLMAKCTNSLGYIYWYTRRMSDQHAPHTYIRMYIRMYNTPRFT